MPNILTCHSRSGRRIIDCGAFRARGIEHRLLASSNLLGHLPRAVLKSDGFASTLMSRTRHSPSGNLTKSATSITPIWYPRFASKIFCAYGSPSSNEVAPQWIIESPTTRIAPAPDLHASLERREKVHGTKGLVATAISHFEHGSLAIGIL